LIHFYKRAAWLEAAEKLMIRGGQQW